MSKNESFLLLYKELEEALLKVNPNFVDNKEMSAVRLAEEKYPNNASRLRYCRFTRNYIAHESDADKFIEISDEMMNFLKSFIGELIGTAKSLSKTLKSSSLLPNDTVLEAAKKMKKNSFIVIADQDNVFGLLTETDIKDAFAKEELTKKTKVSSLIKTSSLSLIGELKDKDSGEKVIKMLKSKKAIVVRNNQNKIVGVVI